MPRPLDSIPGEIACLNLNELETTLVSDKGYHCQVWQTSRLVSANDEIQVLDVVIKRCREPVNQREAAIYYRDYRNLRKELGEMVPRATFVITEVDGDQSLIVIAETARIWFNIANPSYLQEAIPLLRRLDSARNQLAHFVAVAKRWQQEGKIIDLYGLDNLVLSRNRRIRYLDSFQVFFYEDLLHMVELGYEDLEDKINVSLQRLDYLEFLMQEVNIRCII